MSSLKSPTARWSPITSFSVQPLTPSGLLSLDISDGEVEIYSTTFIELRSLTPMNTAGIERATDQNKWHDRDMDLSVTLTTHRIVLQTSPSSPFSTSNFLHLSNIQSHSTTGGEWLSNKSYKIIIGTLTHGEFYFVFRGKVPKQDRDSFYSHLEKTLIRRQWEEASRLHSTTITGAEVGRTITSTGVGVAAIVERNRLRHEHNAKLATQAFGGSSTAAAASAHSKAAKKEREQEVETLMREAKELTNVIHKYVATLEKSSLQNNKNDSDDQEFQSMLSHMGMITAIPSKPSSSKSSSSVYYDTLARQICDFLLQNKSFSIAKGGNGIMTLTDVYCLFNRARGANMISPEDLISALEQMDKLGLGMKIREFENGSGVSVLQETGFDDRVMVQKITDYVDTFNDGRRRIGVTALEAGRILKISPLLANEQLLSAEQNGYLCRDVTLEGTRFFCNLFTL